jgi:hypothetical protein
MLIMQIIKKDSIGFTHTGKRIKKIKHSIFDVFKELHTYPERFQSFYRMNKIFNITSKSRTID